MINRKRLTRVVGVSVLTGATVLSQSGVAGATELVEESSDTTAGVPGSYLDTLESKYGSQGTDVTSIGSIANITAEDCAAGNVTSIGSIVNVDEACADKITSIGSIVKTTTSAPETKTEVKTETKTEDKAKTETKTEKVEKATEDCPTNPVLEYNYSVNGVSKGHDLSGLKAGDVVKVDFTIAPGCEDVELSIASYDTPSDTFSVETADQQKLSDHESGKFDAGKHSMDVVIPECFYQMDFARGGVITNLSENNLYGKNLISSINGGQECVAPEVVVPPTPETPEAPQPVVEVQEVQLAHTGVDTLPLATFGSALLLVGVALERASKRMRQTGAVAAA